MRVSQRTEYGVRAMIALARDFDEVISIKELAERESMPETFLEQIMSDLRKAGLLKSVRGPNGGFRLKDAPSEITIGRVIATLEGSLSPARCGSDCSKQDGCSTRSVLDRIERAITETLDGIYLKDLVGDLAHE
ncbi:MAG: Rrf2 family transcriptional regulator [Actinomycetia bacterium]|nr:Rrf2 family transcriptional regulator [Actinomycetes bacterium]